jgi:hypothetical protein
MSDSSSAGCELRATTAVFFHHPVFKEAMADLAVLGINVSLKPAPGAEPYAVVSGRSNARWWLFPLRTGRLTASGLGLFQPVLSGARHMKTVASWLSRVHLQHLWARQKVYVTYGTAIDDLYGGEARSFAFFTGTDSPHRKVAVQIMDGGGRILGFAKLTRNADVAALLMHEAATLQRLRAFALRTANVPRVLRAGCHGIGTLLVTDSLKTGRSRVATQFTTAHQQFVGELTQASGPVTRPMQEIATRYQVRVGQVRARLAPEWHQRLEDATAALASLGRTEVQTALSHGDFTPSNTFFCDKGLYVFDWEYAEDDALPGNDVAHFLLNEPRSRILPAVEKLRKARLEIVRTNTGVSAAVADGCLLGYLLTQCLRQLERLPTVSPTLEDWDGAEDQAAMLDHLLRKPLPEPS